MIDVITGFHPAGFTQYGQRCLDTFEQYWCKHSFRIIPYTEERIGHKNERDIAEIAPLMNFLDRHETDEAVHGRRPKPCWKLNEVHKGYSYRTDAYKFCRIPFIIQDALTKTDAEYLIWLDGDTVTFNPVNREKILNLLPPGRAVAYLGRGEKHTECGFLLFNTSLARSIIKQWARWYADDTFKALDEWHNSYIFDVVIEDKPELRHDMTPGGHGHVWFQSELGSFIDHLKGVKRKELGYSPERYK